MLRVFFNDIAKLRYGEKTNKYDTDYDTIAVNNLRQMKSYKEGQRKVHLELPQPSP